MGFSAHDYDVRVDIFKSSGKWYTTISMVWRQYNTEDDVLESFRRSLEEYILVNRAGTFKGMIAVCLKPNCENACPLLMVM